MDMHYHLCFQVGRVARQLVSFYNRALAPFGLTTAQYFVLAAIKPDETPTMGELSSRTYLDNSTLTPIVDRLERDGWIERVADPSDRRAVRIALTAKGHEQLPRARTQGDAVEQAMRNELGDDMVELLTDGLRQVARIDLEQLITFPEQTE